MACTRKELLKKINDYLYTTHEIKEVDPIAILEIAMRSRNLVCFDLMAQLTKKKTMRRQDIINIINRMILDIQ